MLIIALAIPLSITTALVLLYFTGHTINIMTLGGLALAVGTLVDNSIVVLENIHRHLEMGKSVREAAADGASEVALPLLVITVRSEEHTSELQSPCNLVCRLLLEKKKYLT